MLHQLSQGSIKAICHDENESPLCKSPVLQLINIKAIQVNETTRYRAIVSDGVNFMQAMLATNHTALVEQGQVKRHSIIRVNDFSCSLLSNKKVLIILNIDVVESDVEAKVGSPVAFDPTVSAPTTTKAAETARIPEPQVQTTSSGNSYLSGANAQLENSLTAIKNLNPYQNRWTIKGRVTQKSPIKTWHNNRGDGKLFSVNFLDQGGEIKATAFNDQVDRLYNMFEEGNVYYISKAKVTMARKQFSTIDNEYELTLEAGTEIELCPADNSIPKMSFKFVKISDLETVEPSTNIDACGIVIEDGGLTEIVTKSTGRPTNKRELTIGDESGKSVRLTLWDKVAEEFDSSNNPIIAVRGVRVSDFNGRSLSLSASGTMKVNPDIPETKKLRQWFSEIGKNPQKFESFSKAAAGSFTGEPNGNTPKIDLLHVRTDNLGSGSRTDFFNFKGTISYIKQDNLAYPSCPECKKKMLQEETGWRCEKCQKTYPSPEWRYIVTMGVNDSTSQIFANSFDDPGRLLIGSTATDLMELKEKDTTAFQRVCNKALFKAYNFKGKAKTEVYNDQSRVKYTLLEAAPIDFIKESKELVQTIEKLLN